MHPICRQKKKGKKGPRKQAELCWQNRDVAMENYISVTPSVCIRDHVAPVCLIKGDWGIEWTCLPVWV